MGKSVIELAAPDAYRLWSASYDTSENPVLALETRLLQDRLTQLAGRRMLDVATGTGRWADYAASQCAEAIGLDLSMAMLDVAAQKPALRGRLAVGDMRALPFANRSFDIAMCSFALGYVESPQETIAELARVAQQVIVTDIHPLAISAGWSRSFRAGGNVYRIRNYSHSLSSLEQAAKAVGLESQWHMEARFGLPEKRLFRNAGREDLYIQAQQVPAIFAQCWRRVQPETP